MFKFLTTAATAALLATQAFAQTHSDCNPTKGDTCPDNPALGTTFDYKFNDSMAEMDSKYFNVTAGPKLMDFTKEGTEFAIYKHGDSATVKTNFFIFYGRVEAIMQSAHGQGIISTVNLISSDLDEIDWEIKGGDTATVHNNWYGKGNETQLNGESPELANPGDDYHNYTINWTEEKIEWWLDDKNVRTVNADEAGKYPQTPCQVYLSLWAGGDPDNVEGTIKWAGGETNYDEGPYVMKVKSLYIEDGHQNVTSYRYTDDSGSHASIEAEDGESDVYKELNKLSTTQKAEKKWTGLSNTAKIAIGASVGGTILLVCIIYTFVCITQRKKGRLEREAHDKEWAAHEDELSAYRQKMARGDFAISHLGHGEQKF